MYNQESTNRQRKKCDLTIPFNHQLLHRTSASYPPGWPRIRRLDLNNRLQTDSHLRSFFSLRILPSHLSLHEVHTHSFISPAHIHSLTSSSILVSLILRYKYPLVLQLQWLKCGSSSMHARVIFAVSCGSYHSVQEHVPLHSLSTHIFPKYDVASWFTLPIQLQKTRGNQI